MRIISRSNALVVAVAAVVVAVSTLSVSTSALPANIFQSAGVAYSIPEGESFVEALERFKSSTPNSTEISSANFPNAYPVGSNQKFVIDLQNSTGVELIVHSLDIDPLADYLKLTPFDKNGVERRPVVLTGKLLQPLRFRSLGFTRIEVVFGAWTDEDHQRSGFLISYVPHGVFKDAPLPPADIQTPFEELQTVTKAIVVREAQQVNQTWVELKEIVCEATNNYLRETLSVLERCAPANVTFVAITKCPTTWPNAPNCVEMTFAVSLYQNRSLISSDVDDYLAQFTPRSPAGLNATQLNEMWQRCGRSTLLGRNFEEYERPDRTAQVYMWIALGLGAVSFVMLVMVGIFRSGLFDEKLEVEDEKPQDAMNGVSAQKQDDDDITMYVTSPEQIMPEVYPAVLSECNERSGASSSKLPHVEEVVIEADTHV